MNFFSKYVLPIPCTNLINYVCNGFAVLYIFNYLIEQSKITKEVAAEYLVSSTLKMENNMSSYEKQGRVLAMTLAIRMHFSIIKEI